MGQTFDPRTRCHVCGSTENLQWHHIFNGPVRKASTNYGCGCYLCWEHHLGNGGVHNNRELADMIRAECEMWWLQTYHKSIGEFIQIFGRNYI